MKNPFERFKDYQVKKKEIPLDRIVKLKEQRIEKITSGYNKFLEEEVKSLVWLVERSRIIEAYSRAEKALKDVDFTSEDIEEFCYELDNSERIPYLITGPAGIFLSVLCNKAKEKEIKLHLNDLKKKVHLLGHKLPEGKRLIIEGNMGDFIGVSLEGGEIIIEGDAQDWTGAGMRRGKVVVKKNVGYHTGEWMMGGEIWVGERIRGLGKMVNGRIYEGGRLITPNPSQPTPYQF